MEYAATTKPKPFHGHILITSLILLLLVVVFNISVYPQVFYHYNLPIIAMRFMLVWLFAAILFCILSYSKFVVGFLLSLFCMMIAWRIAGTYDVYLITIPLTFAFLGYLANFLYCATKNIKNHHAYLHTVTMTGWQLIFIRLYIGLNFIPHFTEKLFAGTVPHMNDVQAFIQLGLSHPDLFVWLAGLCELVAAFCISTGFLLRVGSLFAVVYLFIAAYLGHHFSLGFIWSVTGGGWEFATMWAIIIYSFCITGVHQFSIDQSIEDTFNLPTFIKKLL